MRKNTRKMKRRKLSARASRKKGPKIVAEKKVRKEKVGFPSGHRSGEALGTPANGKKNLVRLRNC